MSPPIFDEAHNIESVPARADLGIHTQPISFAGLPSLAVPLRRVGGALPIGVQLIGRRGGEAALLRAAAAWEDSGLIGATAPVIEDVGEWA